MTILVVGSTGKTGRRIADKLTALGLPVRAGSRSGTPPFDWKDRATWAAALRDVQSVYISYYSDIAVPGAVDDIRAFTEQAVAAGVRRLVLLSGRNEAQAQAAERVVQESGAEWTIVTCSWFMQNFTEGYLLDPVREGVIALPARDVAEPFVDVDDIADVAVAALTEDGHTGKVYELTGPRLLTFAEVATELSKVTGRDVVYVPLSLEEYAAGAAEVGLPKEVIDMLTMLFAETLDGRNSYLAEGVQQALGRPARDFSDYARANAAAWAQSR
jgi:uncharacterized protein YbjT (DUF2867 family)